MSQATRWLKDVKRLLDRYDGEAPPEAGDLLDQQVELIDGLNGRLERCVSLLRKGLYGEAMHQAQVSPNVLDEAATLSGPEAQQWAEVCRAARLGKAPSLDENAIIEVDEAFVRGEPHEKLLRKHRLYALGRVDLPRRIAVLRELSARELDCTFWGDDLADFETLRLEQMVGEVEAAAAAGDRDQLERLGRELATPWLIKPPSGLVRAATDATLRLRDRDARQRLDALREPLASALAAEDEAAVEPLLQTWSETRKQLRGRDFDEGVARQAAAWCRDQKTAVAEDQRWEQALVSLEHALDAPAPLEEIERCWVQVEKFERPVPEVLKTRFRSRQGASRHAQSRRHRAVMLAVVCGLIGVLAAAGGGLWWVMDQRSRAGWETAITEAIENDRWDTASTLLGQLETESPRLYGSPTFVAFERRVAEQASEELTRAKRWGEAIGRAEKAGVETPDLTSLELAESLAKTDAETERTLAWKMEVEQEQLRRRAAVNEQYRGLLAELRDRLDTVRSADPPDVAAIESLRRDLVRLDALTGVDPSLSSGGAALTLAVDTLLNQVRGNQEQKEGVRSALDRIRAAGTRAEAVDRALLDFIVSFPDHPRTGDMDRARKLNASLSTVSAWNALPGASGVLVDSAQDVTRAREQIAAALEKMIGLANAPPVVAYQEYLGRAAVALAAGDGLYPLHDLLKSPALTGLRIIDLNDGRQLYTHHDDPIKEMGLGNVAIRYIETAEQLVGQQALREEMTQAEQLGGGGKTRPAPQEFWVDAVGARLDAGQARWESAAWDAAADILPRDDIDPILRAAVARQLGGHAISGGWAVPGVSDPSWRALSKLPDTDLAWFDSNNARVASARIELRQALDRLDPLKPAGPMLEAWRLDMRAALSPREIAVMYWPGPDGEPGFASERVADGAYELWRGEAHGDRFTAVVTVADGVADWTDAALDLPAGTLLVRRMELEDE